MPHAFLVFADLKGFSNLEQAQVHTLFTDVWTDLAQATQKPRAKAKYFDTWGDGLVAVFEEGHPTLEFLFAYLYFFQAGALARRGLQALQPRIGAHFGEIEIYNDPLTGRPNVLGAHLHTAARIEPITPPGEILVTEEFKQAIDRLPIQPQDIAFDRLGMFPLAKSFGERELYRLRKRSAPGAELDRVFRLDLASALPEPPKPTEREIVTLRRLKRTPTRQMVRERADAVMSTPNDAVTGDYLLDMAKHCKSAGLYPEALVLLERIEKYTIEADDVQITPYLNDPRVWKLKANVLTRLGMYPEAANHVYWLWRQHPGDSDVLSMLAANYKRRALFGGNLDESVDKLSRDSIDRRLLTRARNLYLEAFRLNIDDYYPAINAAYLYKMLGGKEVGQGNKLATHIRVVWGKDKGRDWWTDATLAEAELVLGDYDAANSELKDAIATHEPNIFELQSTLLQIRIHAALVDEDDESREIDELLQQAIDIG